MGGGQSEQEALHDLVMLQIMAAVGSQYPKRKEEITTATDAIMQLIHQHSQSLTKSLLVEVEQRLLQAQIDALQSALDHDRSVDSGKYLDGGKQFRVLWLEKKIAALQVIRQERLGK